MSGIYVFLFAIYIVLLFGVGSVCNKLDNIIKYLKRRDKE